MSGDNKRNIIILIIVIIIILAVFIGSAIMSKKKNNEELKYEDINYNDVDNVAAVDEKLKLGDYRVTQGYLLNYTKRKGNTWYSSRGIITKIKDDGMNISITLKDENGSNTIIAHISNDDFNLKKNDVVNFVGSINISDGSINLARISKDEIDYNNVVKLSFNDLYMNIYYLKNTYVLVSGYLITFADNYKLYESKEAYKKDETLGTFFYIEWNGTFNYTGSQNVTLKCFIGDRYKLVGCELIK